MSLPRFMIQEALDASKECVLALNADELHHLLVRRIAPGEHIAVFCEDGQAWEVEITDLQNEQVTARVCCELAQELLPRLTLVQGISKGDRMTQSIRQATELGVERIIPFMSQRCIVRIKGADIAKKGERFRSVSLAAVKQCGRNFLPLVDDPSDITEVCEQLASYDRVVVAWEDAQASDIVQGLSIGQALEGCSMQSKVALVIGPEGGLSEEEIRTFIAKLQDKVQIVSLGELILRTETASTVASALCMYELGALGNTPTK